MARRILVLEHMDHATPDAGLAHLRARGAEARVVQAWQGEALPELKEIPEFCAQSSSSKR